MRLNRQNRVDNWAKRTTIHAERVGEKSRLQVKRNELGTSTTTSRVDWVGTTTVSQPEWVGNDQYKSTGTGWERSVQIKRNGLEAISTSQAERVGSDHYKSSGTDLCCYFILVLCNNFELHRILKQCSA